MLEFIKQVIERYSFIDYITSSIPCMDSIYKKWDVKYFNSNTSTQHQRRIQRIQDVEIWNMFLMAGVISLI